MNVGQLSRKYFEDAKILKMKRPNKIAYISIVIYSCIIAFIAMAQLCKKG